MRKPNEEVTKRNGKNRFLERIEQDLLNSTRKHKEMNIVHEPLRSVEMLVKDKEFVLLQSQISKKNDGSDKLFECIVRAKSALLRIMIAS